MGLLDEAIRQHLELKRQHGASDEELHMQEQEALGPVRREPVEPAAAGAEEAEPAMEQAVEPVEASAAGLEEAEPALEEPEEAVYDEPPVEVGEDAPVYEEALAEPALDAPPEAFHEPADPYGPDEADAETDALAPEQDFESSGETPRRGFEAVEEPVPEDALPDEGEDGEDGEDVLEETPEFLQETPEHDRLWFEQKPPRDFDFDE